MLCTVLAAQAPPPDWLLEPSTFVARAEVAADGRELVLDNGIARATFRLQPDVALVSLRQLRTGQELLRAVRPLAALVLDGKPLHLGGLLGQPDHAFLRPEWLAQMTADPAAGHGVLVHRGPIRARLDWARVRRAAPDAVWPPRGVEVAFAFTPPAGTPGGQGLDVTVHWELYDGLPLFGTWLEVRQRGAVARELTSVTTCELAAVEGESRVDPARTSWQLPPIHVETDFAFGGMTAGDANSHVVHWVADPHYATQVHYDRQTPCLLQVRPEVGPAVTLGADADFRSWRTWLLLPETDHRDRETLAQRRLYRVLAPWVTENPLMLHVRSTAPEVVRSAVEQCAEVGFEMAILSFGSGFDLEDQRPETLAKWRELAAFAAARHVELGGYSLLSSRRIEPDGDNCIAKDTGKPGGQRFGFAPALASGWGQRYFRTLYGFFPATGFTLLEHDGSYPGDFDAAPRPPLQKGWDDSQWVQYGIIAGFYRWCRQQGVFLNVPDYYYLAGANKCGMGYRETNWSLPRELQVIHARQNLFDGTRGKTPSMGWMFAPLTEYQGGGAAATVEPLDQHREHYAAMLDANLGYGAQACWRGTRLYDTAAVRDLVRGRVQWFLQHRDILESDVVHGSSRRADGADLDWVLHANPALRERGMLVVWNPTAAAVRRQLRLDLTFTGLRQRARQVGMDGSSQEVAIAGDGTALVAVEVPAGGAASWVLRAED